MLLHNSRRVFSRAPRPSIAFLPSCRRLRGTPPPGRGALVARPSSVVGGRDASGRTPPLLLPLPRPSSLAGPMSGEPSNLRDALPDFKTMSVSCKRACPLCSSRACVCAAATSCACRRGQRRKANEQKKRAKKRARREPLVACARAAAVAVSVRPPRRAGRRLLCFLACSFEGAAAPLLTLWPCR